MDNGKENGNYLGVQESSLRLWIRNRAEFSDVSKPWGLSTCFL